MFNRKNTSRTRRLMTLLAGTLLLGTWSTHAAAQNCPTGTSPISWNSPEGTSWDMCWSHETLAGVTLRNIFYTDGTGARRLVLRDASVAQLFVAYDDGSSRVDHVTQGGLGGNRMRTLTIQDCFGTGSTLQSHDNRQALCTREVKRGYLFKWYNNQAQGHLLELFSIADINEQTFVVRWRFFEDGTIEPAVGHSGRISRYNNNTAYSEAVGRNGNATSWMSNVFWRLDFDINGAGNDAVREFNIQRHGSNNERQRRITTDLTQESGRTLNPRTMRSWQILDTAVTNSDGQNISYELAPQQGGVRHVSTADAWSTNDLHVTRFRSCERYVMNNPVANCKTSIDKYTNGESIFGTNIVVWYRVSRHHLPRDEDIPYRSMKWDFFKIIPRDWNALSPLTFVQPGASLTYGGTA